MKEIRGWFRRFIANLKCRVPTVVENGGCFARLRDADFFFDSKKQKMMVTTATTASAHEPTTRTTTATTAVEKVKVTEGEQILRILSSRVERAVRAATPANDVNNDETATATATTTTTTTTMMPTVQLSLKDLCGTARKYAKDTRKFARTKALDFHSFRQLEKKKTSRAADDIIILDDSGANLRANRSICGQTMPANLQNLYRARKSFALPPRYVVPSRRRQGWLSKQPYPIHLKR